MASLFNVLGELGSNYAGAKQQIQDEKIRNVFAINELAGMRTQREGERQLLEQRKQSMKDRGWDKAVTFLGAEGKKYQYNPITSAIRPYQLPEGAIEEGSPEYTLDAIEKGMHRKFTQEERELFEPLVRIPGYAALLKQNEPSFSSHFAGLNDKGRPTEFAYDPKHPEKGKLDLGPVYERPSYPPGSEPQLSPTRLKALANMWERDGTVPQAKYKDQVEEYMEANKMRPKTKLSNNDQKNVELIKQLQPKIDNALKLIEGDSQSKDPLYGKDLSSQDNWLFGSNSVLARRGQLFKYGMGKTPSSDKRISDIIRAAAALKVMGVAPWTQLGRGKYLYQDITVHLPDPHDTPKQLYEKLLFLKGVIDDAQDSLPEGAMNFGRQTGATPNSALDAIDAIIKRGSQGAPASNPRP